jgi:hypothetical protein
MHSSLKMYLPKSDILILYTSYIYFKLCSISMLLKFYINDDDDLFYTTKIVLHYKILNHIDDRSKLT